LIPARHPSGLLRREKEGKRCADQEAGNSATTTASFCQFFPGSAVFADADILG
jgi:hypothetical protein